MDKGRRGRNPVPFYRVGKGGVEHRIVAICISHIDSSVKPGSEGFKPSMFSHQFA
jgi:hypothetical protein